MKQGTRKVERNGKSVQWFNCSDCGMVHEPLKKNTLRPNCKFCNRDCMAYVLENSLMAYSGRRPNGWKKWVENYDRENTKEVCA